MLTVRAKLSYNKIFLREFTGNPNEQNKSNNEQASIFRSVVSGHQKGYRYDYAKPSMNCTRLCYTDTHNYKIQVKSEDVYVDLAEDFETRFNTSNYEVDRPLAMKLCHV